MADAEIGQEKTEEASVRRLMKAREEGNVPRSRELGAVFMMMGGMIALISFSTQFVQTFIQIFHLFLSVPRDILQDEIASMQMIWLAVHKLSSVLLPFLALLMVFGIAGQLSVGGWNFTLKSITPSFTRLDPINGIKKIFSIRSVVESLKAFAKFCVVMGFSAIVLYVQLPKLLALNTQPLEVALQQGLNLLAWGFIAIASALILIAAVDVPFQVWFYKKSLRMTKQEVRDEMKETEGRPEVKSRIRRIQRDMARARMMEKVPQADVIITNPDHYAVALKYDANKQAAPLVLAKGADQVAFKIMEIAKHHKIIVLRAPPLARSVYFTTELGKEIPEGLYLAVAQILAYVYQLKQHKKGQAAAPGPVPKYTIPENLRH